MDPTSLLPPERFFCLRDGRTEGPFDLIELAGQLKVAQISADTLIRRDGMESWSPFHDVPEFAAARQVPIEVIARHLEEKERAIPPASGTKKTAFTLRSIAVPISISLLVLAAAAFFSYRPPPANAVPPPPFVMTAPNKDITFTFARAFRADVTFVLNREGMPHTGTLFVDNGKARIDAEIGDESWFILIRPDLVEAYQLHANHISAHPMPHDLPSLGLIPPDGVFESIGTEILQGVNYAKYMQTINGKTSFVWVDQQTQAPVMLVAYNGVGVINYSNYKAGPQDTSLFEAPASH